MTAVALSMLDIAEAVLRDHGTALHPEDIVVLAMENQYLSSQGKTPSDSMRARLSVDIATYGVESRFKRLAPNRFGLRVWDEPEYVSKPFKPKLPNEILACISRTVMDSIAAPASINPTTADFVRILSDPAAMRSIPRPEAELRDDVVQLITYGLLRSADGRILRFQRGGFTAGEISLIGRSCIGFGGHVQAHEPESFFRIVREGLVLSIGREIYEELGGVLPTSIVMKGVLRDDTSLSGARHLGIIFEALLPSTFSANIVRREKVITGLKLRTLEQLYLEHDRLEFWSQLLLESANGERQKVASTIRGNRFKPRGWPLVVTGEIATGKSTVCNFLSRRYNLRCVSTRRCVADLIGMPDFGSGNRELFQKTAEALVTSHQGADRLAENVAMEVRKFGTETVLIDGIRRLQTLRRLKYFFPDLTLLYVDAPRNVSFIRYKSRTKRLVSIEEFRRVRSHPVENEVVIMQSHASNVLYNQGAERELDQLLSNWMSHAL